jgi:hypothetical protein
MSSETVSTEAISSQMPQQVLQGAQGAGGAGLAPPADYSGSYFRLFSDEPAVPSANELLSLRILKDANPAAFANLAAEETKWLAISLGLLRRDTYLQLMMGGKGVRQAMKLSGLLKQKAEQSHFNHRINGVVDRMVGAKFAENGWDGLMPVKGDRIQEFLGYDKQKNIVIRPFRHNPTVLGGNQGIKQLNEELNEQGDMIMKPLSSLLGDN